LEIDVENGIDIDKIMLEIKCLPEYETQLSLQSNVSGDGSEGRLSRVDQEKEFTTFVYDLPYTNYVLSTLKMYRCRLLNMMPKTCYTYHNDPTMRIHIPLITNKNCFFVVDDIVSRYPADGSYYLIDTTKKHTFVNASQDERLHIVGCVGDVKDNWVPYR